MEGYYDDRSAGNASIGSIDHDFNERARAQRQVFGLRGGLSEAAAPERDLRQIIARLNEAIGSAGVCAERIHEIADRVKGPVPEGIEKAAPGSGGMGDIAEIHILLDVLTDRISRTGDGIGRLERL